MRSKLPTVEIPEVPLHFAVMAEWEQRGDRIALVNGATGQEYSYGRLKDLVQSVASGLIKLGVKKGDVLTIDSPNSPEYCIVFFAAISVGAIVTTVNPVYTVYEVKHQLQDSKSSYIYTVSEIAPVVKEAAKQAGGIKAIITNGNVDGCTPLSKLMLDDGKAFEHVPIDPKEDVVVLPYSSGTTGLPKGVMLTHYNIISVFIMTSVPQIKDPKLQSDEVQQVLLGFLPFFHIYGMLVVMCGALAGGHKVVTLPRFIPEQFLYTIQKYKVNLLPLVPPVVVFMAKSPLVQKYDLSSIKNINSGAAPLASDTETEFKTKMNIKELKQGYGLTETSALVACATIDNFKPGSSGVIVPNTEVMIVEPSSGKEMGPNERGEIWVRGPQVMKGYWGQPQKTRDCIDDQGWFHTGDVGYLEPDSTLYIVDRLKELIKYKGFQVAPAELEALLLNHPGVADVGVIGVPDEAAGELPRAYVVRKAGADVTTQSITDFVDEHVAPFKRLRGGVIFLDQIPKSPSGKILRRELRDMSKLGNLKSKV